MSHQKQNTPQPDLKKLEAAIGYHFQNLSLLRNAMTHSS